MKFTNSPKHVMGYLECFSAEVNNHLEDLRGRFSTGEILRHLESLRNMEIVLVGETIIDEYVYCDALGKSGKEPVLAMKVSVVRTACRRRFGHREPPGELLRQSHALHLSGRERFARRLCSPAPQSQSQTDLYVQS